MLDKRDIPFNKFLVQVPLESNLQVVPQVEKNNQLLDLKREGQFQVEVRSGQNIVLNT